MYVAVKGGERAIENANRLLASERRGDPAVPELSLAQIIEQMGLAVDRVMAEGSLYDKELAALAIKQAQGDLMEAIFLLRAFRTTLPRFATSVPLSATRLQARRRISATFKDIPGGQILGPTYDYTLRILDFDLAQEAPVTDEVPANIAATAAAESTETLPRVLALLGDEQLIEPARDESDGTPPGDLTRQPLSYPAGREIRLQNLARGDEGFLLGLAYSSQRGFGSTHPFAGEIRMGEVEVSMIPEELGFAVVIGEITVTECEMINHFHGEDGEPPRFTRGYGLVFGHCERKAMAMALVDRALRARELGEAVTAPVQDEEFVLSHSDSVEASGFLQHLKLPHYVDFQGELDLIRRLQADAVAPGTER